MKVLFCGSRKWVDYWLIGARIAGLQAIYDDLSIITGTTPKTDPNTGDYLRLEDQVGADCIAAWWCKLRDIPCTIIDADWAEAERLYGYEHRGKAGPDRNSKMLALEPDVVFAFRLPGKSGGTDDTVRKARALGIRTIVVDKDGVWHESS